MQSIGEIEAAVQSWLEGVVIGLNLCPFAHKPFRDDRVRMVVELADDYDTILERMLAELRYLECDTQESVETSLIVVPNALLDFHEYLACLTDINVLVEEQGYEGVFQIASFHPKYQFDGTDPDDQSNLTNRSPFPIFHIIREASLERVLAGVDTPEDIPERNIKLMESLDERRIATLFPWVR